MAGVMPPSGGSVFFCGGHAQQQGVIRLCAEHAHSAPRVNFHFRHGPPETAVNAHFSHFAGAQRLADHTRAARERVGWRLAALSVGIGGTLRPAAEHGPQMAAQQQQGEQRNKNEKDKLPGRGKPRSCVLSRRAMRAIAAGPGQYQ